MAKPHRFVIERVASYAEEGGAFLRRRRMRARPFARIWLRDGTIEAPDVEGEDGRRLLAAAERLLDPDRGRPDS